MMRVRLKLKPAKGRSAARKKNQEKEQQRMKRFKSDKYSFLKGQLTNVKFNCLFARSVIEHHVNGMVYVDNDENPNNAYILHPYGMSLLIGNGRNADFCDWLIGYMLNRHKERKNDEWMQVFSENWRSTLENELRDRLLPAEKNIDSNYSDYVEVNTRVNFKFNETKYRAE